MQDFNLRHPQRQEDIDRGARRELDISTPAVIIESQDSPPLQKRPAESRVGQDIAGLVTALERDQIDGPFARPQGHSGVPNAFDDPFVAPSLGDIRTKSELHVDPFPAVDADQLRLGMRENVLQHPNGKLRCCRFDGQSNS